MQNYRQGQQIVIGNYKLLIQKLLGQGSFGQVYQVCDWVNQKQIYALKIQDGMSDQEAQITQIIRDKNPKGIVKIYEFIKQNNSYLILMEYLPNNLYEVITTQAISEIQLRYIFKQLAETLQSLHDLNIAHRDLKPENILVENIGEQRNQLTFKLCDFGISKIETKELFKTMNIGTPYYQAPEQLDNVCFDKSVDIWALGAIFYEIITRKPLFNGQSIQQVQSLIKDKNHSIEQINKLSINQDFKDLILRMVQVDVSQRITLNSLIQKLKPRVERSPIIVQQQIQTLQNPSSQRYQNIQQPFKNDKTQKNDTVLLSKSPIIVTQQNQPLQNPSSQRYQNIQQPFKNDQKNDYSKKNDIEFNNQINNSDQKKAPQKIVQQQINSINNNLNPASQNGTIQPFQLIQGQNNYHKPDQQNNFNNRQDANQYEEKQSNNQSGHNKQDTKPKIIQKINYVTQKNAQTVQIQKQNQPLNAIPYVNEKNTLLNNQQSTQEQIKQYNHVENQDVKNVTPPQKQDSIKSQNNNGQIQISLLQDKQKYNDITKIVPKQQNFNNQTNKTQQLNAGSPTSTRQSRADLHIQNLPSKVNQQQKEELNENSEIQRQVQPFINQSQYINSNQDQSQSIQIQNINSLDNPINQESQKDQEHIEHNNIKQIRNINNNPIPQAAIKSPLSRVSQSQPPINNQLNTIQPSINSHQQQNIQTNQNKIPSNYFGQKQIGNNISVVQQLPPSQGKIPNQSNFGQVQAIAKFLPVPSNNSKGIDIKPIDTKFKQDDRPNSQNQSNKNQISYQPIVIGGVPQLKKG